MSQTGGNLRRLRFITKCNKELASVTFQSPDFEYTPSDVPEVGGLVTCTIGYDSAFIKF